MKKTFILMAFVLSAAGVTAQKPSPPAVAEGTIDGVKVKLAYSAPSAKGRKIMGGLVPFGEVWRTGANEATTFEIDKPIKLEGQPLAAAKYELFTIPGESEWVVIIQTYGKQWGHFKYNQANDVLRVKVKPGKTASMVETFNISVGKDEVVMKWENTQVAFKIARG